MQKKKGFFLKIWFPFLEPIWFPKTGDNEVQPNRLLHFVVPRFWEPKKYPFSGTDICVLGTFFSISALPEWLTRGPQNNLKKLAVLFLSTGCFRNELKLS